MTDARKALERIAEQTWPAPVHFRADIATLRAALDRAEAAEAKLAEAENKATQWAMAHDDLLDQIGHKHLDACPLAREAARGAAERGIAIGREAAEAESEVRIEALEAALLSYVSHNPWKDGLPCWCVGEGDTHNPRCLAARAALADGRKP